MVSLTCFSASALAQARDAWAAPWDAFFLPLGSAPVAGCTVDTGFRIVNYLSYSEGTWGNINTDFELWTVRLGLRVSSPIGEFGVAVPVHLAWGGILDPALNAFHKLLGVGFSPEPPLSEIRFSLSSGESRVVQGTRFGIGDAILTWAYRLEPIWVRISLGLPTGNANQFFGAGGWRVQLSAGLERQLFGVRIGVLVPLGQQLAFEPLKPQVSIQLKIWWQIPFDLPIKLELHATTSPVQIGGQFAATVFALRFVWQTSVGAITFAEDLSPTLPDVVLAWDGQFAC